jgi:DNA-binding MarR family transcriptional regulator
MTSSKEPEVPPTVDEVVRGLYRIFQSIDHFSRKSLRELGVSGPQVWALRTIRDAECTTERELARRIHLPPGTVSGLVDRLEAHGAAARRAAHEGDRVVELRLTSSGRQLASRAPEPPQSRIARGVELLPLGDLACLHRAVEILARLLESEGPTNDEHQSNDTE